MERGKRRLFLHVLLLSVSCLSLVALPSSATDSPPKSTGGAPTERDIGFQGGASSRPEWQILTKSNFSSQIRAHPHILLLVTVPWSGESRSLKKNVIGLVSTIQDDVGDLKLMLVHKNLDKLIADSLGAIEESTLFYYHHSKRFRYRGRMNARAILSSVLYLMSFEPEEAPLKSLNSVEELQSFLNSTDECIFLVEFCGWSSKLLQQQYSGNGDNFVAPEGLYEEGEITGENFTAGGAPLFDGKENLKATENDKLSCSLDHIQPPWFGASIWGIKNISSGAHLERTGNGVHCSMDEFKKFGSFFTKLMKVARETLLPPERLRFGYISDKSLLSYLDVGSPANWMLLHWIPGCHNCSKTLQEADDLSAALLQDTPVIELDGDRGGQYFPFPMNRPSIVLFIDRSSSSSKISKDSKSALHIFKMLAQENQQHGKFIGNHLSSDSDGAPHKTLKAFTTGYSDVSGQVISKSSTQKVIKFNDQMTVMVISQGVEISPDGRTDVTQVSTAYDLLAGLLHERNPTLNVKKRRMNSLAKEADLLLSDNFDVEVLDSRSHLSDKENDQSDTTTLSSVMEKKKQSMQQSFEVIDHTAAPGIKSLDSFYATNPQYNKAPSSNSEASTKVFPQQSGQETHKRQETVENVEVDKDDKDLVHDKESRSSLHDATRIEEPMHISYQHRRFVGTYYVSDGDYAFLGTLTGALKLPSVIILDPLEEKHYTYEENDLTYSSLTVFVEKYLNGSLNPYQMTEPSLTNQRQNPQPPFVNLDFHESDAIPRMTLMTFPNVVSVSRPYDVLVLFGNPWCGFCQRMELVVREVYRSLKGFMSVSKSGSANKDLIPNQDEAEDVMQDVMPSIFYMDCTLNDCSLQLNKLGKKEYYPALVLFPAEGESLFFEGDVSVNGVFEFILKYGSSSGHLNKYKGILWTQREIQHKDTDVLYNSLSTSTPRPMSDNENERTIISGAVIGDNGHLLINLQEPVETQIKKENVVVGSILYATDALLNSFPFDNSTVLIAKADQDEGFHGMILNKPMSWGSFAKLGEVLTPLKQAPLSYGGPVSVPNLPFVSLSRKAIEGYTELSTGLFYGNPMLTGITIEGIRSGNQSAADLWFFFGFSGWGWNQLLGEIARGDWHLSDGPIEHLEWPES